MEIITGAGEKSYKDMDTKICNDVTQENFYEEIQVDYADSPRGSTATERKPRTFSKSKGSRKKARTARAAVTSSESEQPAVFGISSYENITYENMDNSGGVNSKKSEILIGSNRLPCGTNNPYASNIDLSEAEHASKTLLYYFDKDSYLTSSTCACQYNATFSTFCPNRSCHSARCSLKSDGKITDDYYMEIEAVKIDCPLRVPSQYRTGGEGAAAAFKLSSARLDAVDGCIYDIPVSGKSQARKGHARSHQMGEHSTVASSRPVSGGGLSGQADLTSSLASISNGLPVDTGFNGQIAHGTVASTSIHIGNEPFMTRSSQFSWAAASIRNEQQASHHSQALLAAIFCCLVTGIRAVQHSQKAKEFFASSAWKQGNLMSHKAHVYIKTSVHIGTILWLAGLLLVLFLIIVLSR